MQDPINGNLSEPNNAAPFKSSSVCAASIQITFTMVGSAERRKGFEKYTDEHSDSSWLTRMKCPIILNHC